MLELFFISLAVFIPLIFACLLSATETAVTAVSNAKMHKLKKDGIKQAITISQLKEDKEILISTIIFANNLCNIISSTMATAFLIKVFGDEGVIYATFIMTVLIIVFAEILPKTYAIANPEKVALSFAGFLLVTVTICKPIVKFINLIVSKISFFLRLNTSNMHPISPTDEIKGAIDLHHKQGSVDKHDKYMLDGVFSLSETYVHKVMTHRKNIYSIDIDKPIKEIIDQVRSIPHTRIPMWKENPDNIVGILNTRELLNKLVLHDNFNKFKIKSVLSKPLYVHENTSLDEQLVEFKSRKSRLAIVVDEYGDIQGIITLSDILEEVVGHIYDEKDSADNNQLVIDGNICVVKGDVPVRDINRNFNWHLPEDEVSTIAGLIINGAERIPEVNEEFSFFGFDFVILEKEGNQLTSIKITKNITE